MTQQKETTPGATAVQAEHKDAIRQNFLHVAKKAGHGALIGVEEAAILAAEVVAASITAPVMMGGNVDLETGLPK